MIELTAFCHIFFFYFLLVKKAACNYLYFYLPLTLPAETHSFRSLQSKQTFCHVNVGLKRKK